jgi:hypothetical protein
MDYSCDLYVSRCSDADFAIVSRRLRENRRQNVDPTASKERLQNTVTGLEAFGVQVLAACHCTGFAAMTALERHCGDKVVALYAGHSIRL